MGRYGKSLVRSVTPRRTRALLCWMYVFIAILLALPAAAAGLLPVDDGAAAAVRPSPVIRVDRPHATGPAPRITGFSPTTGPVGLQVIIRGTGFDGLKGVFFNGVAAAAGDVTSTQLRVLVPLGATSGRISVSTSVGTATSAMSFTVTAAPVITGFAPSAGRVGANVLITGGGFLDARSVAFGGTATQEFIWHTATQIFVAVPTGATSGKLAVTTPAGTATSPGTFTVVAAPTITSFTPTSGVAGATVTLTGTGFTGATKVTFNGRTATFTVGSATRITATVPTGATSGKLAVTTPAGTATSPAYFTVIPIPSIEKLSRRSAKRGGVVAIGGSGFGDLRGSGAVLFGRKACATYLSWSATQIKCRVPATAAYGRVKVTVTTAGGTSNAVTFTVKQ